MDLNALAEFKNKYNFNPSTILDIGASNGYFSGLCLQTWPSADITMVESNPLLEQHLERTKIPYIICLLGNENKEDVSFFVSKDDPSSTGNSIYKENSEYFSENRYNVIPLQMYKLDDITTHTFDFIKIDTQGSELDVIKGGINTIKKCKYLLVEVSLISCNEGAPLKNEVVDYLSSIGFKNSNVVYTHLSPNYVVIQEDILFSSI